MISQFALGCVCKTYRSSDPHGRHDCGVHAAVVKRTRAGDATIVKKRVILLVSMEPDVKVNARAASYDEFCNERPETPTMMVA